MSVVVVVPSRGRPAAARATYDAIRATAALVGTSVIIAIDEDDPTRDRYLEAFLHVGFGPEVMLVTLPVDETGNLVRATNTVAMRVAAAEPDAIIANLGDDHRPRTPGWDRRVVEALHTPGIAYGDDGIQGEQLPTAPFISASIVNALGWYALPTCRHLFIDDVWRDLGRGLGVLRYLPDVQIEHLHPAVGKGEWDEGYRKANSDDTTEHDRQAYLQWRASAFAVDVQAVRRALAQELAA